jgi:hypothetical protein
MLLGAYSQNFLRMIFYNLFCNIIFLLKFKIRIALFRRIIKNIYLKKFLRILCLAILRTFIRIYGRKVVAWGTLGDATQA